MSSNACLFVRASGRERRAASVCRTLGNQVLGGELLRHHERPCGGWGSTAERAGTRRRITSRTADVPRPTLGLWVGPCLGGRPRSDTRPCSSLTGGLARCRETLISARSSGIASNALGVGTSEHQSSAPSRLDAPVLVRATSNHIECVTAGQFDARASRTRRFRPPQQDGEQPDSVRQVRNYVDKRSLRRETLTA